MRPKEIPAVLDLIGNTPLVEVSRLDTGPCTLLLKLESQNPGGSIKDRIGISMIEGAERRGALKPGGTVVEATAGNTGLGLALVARAKGYRIVLVVPDKMSTEKVLQLKALGADVRITRSDVGKGHPEYYQDYAARLAQEIPGSFYADQFRNPDNPAAHEHTTGPELWQQSGQHLDAIVVGVGSGGTLTGLTKFFERVAPKVEFVLADPKGSILADYIKDGTLGTAGSWAVEGIGETSSRRWRTFPASLAIRFRTTRASAPRANCSELKVCPAALRPERWSPLRCATAASRRRRSASRPSSATPARATCRRSTTTTGCSTRAC
jgi:cystathionine beta-synthase